MERPLRTERGLRSRKRNDYFTIFKDHLHLPDPKNISNKKRFQLKKTAVLKDHPNRGPNFIHLERV